MAKLKDVNSTDLAGAIGLGCQAMCRMFNADDDDIPFFDILALPEARMSFSWAHSEAQVPGRFLNALLNAEDALGIRIDEQAIDTITRAAFFAYHGAVPLPLNRQRIGGPLVNFLPTQIREGLHALYALVRFRDSEHARELAEACIETIFRCWDPSDGWDYARLQDEHGLSIFKPSSFLNGLGRSIGPLVKYFQATGYGPALDLAIVLKERTVAEFFTENGEYQAAHGLHGHSTTCTMSSLAQLADLTRDAHLLARVKAFYDNGLRHIRDQVGWSIETTKPGKNYGRGEANNTGDIVETALILGRWGHTEYYHDAERILRCHLLPCQLRDVSFIPDPPNPEDEDGKRDVPRRIAGSFGLPAPYGHHPVGVAEVKFNSDIVGGVVGSLCEVYREATRHDAAGHRVNLLFDHETPAIKVRSPYTHSALSVELKRPGPLFVRLPPWVRPGAIEISGPDRPRHTGGCLFFAAPATDRMIRIAYPLEEQEMVMRNPAGEIRVRLRGDTVTAMDDFGADVTFFDPIDR